MTINDKLTASAKARDSLVCVGLDTDTSKLPAGETQLSFNRAIIDATHDITCCYKPNTAFYEAEGAAGIETLQQTCTYIREKSPDTPILLDAKRADIGNTNLGYCKFAFDYLDVDAITLHPYLGGEALAPFLDTPEHGAIILCHTSNSGAEEIQELEPQAKPLYQHVAEIVAEKWNTNRNCMLVMGATYPVQARTVREHIGDDMWLLVPGVGAQGGSVSDALAGLNRQHTGVVVNSSRGIIFASSGADFAQVARQKTLELRDQINAHRRELL